MDEASAIDDTIWEVTEGALTDENTEMIWAVFGNPTRTSGRFRECWGRLRHRWRTRQLDSREVEGTNKIQLAKYIEDYGEDSDFARVRVRGMVPEPAAAVLLAMALLGLAWMHRRQAHARFGTLRPAATVLPA